MPRPRALLVLRVAALVALLVSAALFVDYEHALPTFCAAGGGCDVVRRSAFGKPFGIPVPLIGMAAFVGLLLFSLPRAAASRRYAAFAAMFGGVMGLVFLSIQAFVIQAFCSLCVTVDTMSIVAGIAGSVLLFAKDDTEEHLAPIGWVAMMLAAIGLPITYAQGKPPPPVPDAIAATWVPGKIGVVEMSDFECPFCRLAHPTLDKLRQDQGEKLHYVRITMPLPRHPHARDASRAYLCADAQGKGDAMADKLFATEDLSPEGCRAQAESLGVDMKAYAACLADPKTEALLENNVKRVMSTDFQGLPTVWIGDKRILGVREEADYVSAIADAANGPKSPVGRWWPLAMVVVVSLGLLSFGLRREAS